MLPVAGPVKWRYPGMEGRPARREVLASFAIPDEWSQFVSNCRTRPARGHAAYRTDGGLVSCPGDNESGNRIDWAQSAKPSVNLADRRPAERCLRNHRDSPLGIAIE